MTNCTNTNINNIESNQSDSSYFYNQKLKLFSVKFNSTLEERIDIANKSSIIKNNFKSLKDYFSSNYESLIQDLTGVINNMSNISTNNEYGRESSRKTKDEFMLDE